jgi:hypothetical protein
MIFSSSDCFSTQGDEPAHLQPVAHVPESQPAEQEPDSQPWPSDSSQNSQDVQMTQPGMRAHDLLRRLRLAEESLSAMGYNMRDPRNFPAPLPTIAWQPVQEPRYLPDTPSEAPTQEPTFFHNPYPNGKVPANVYLATEARLRAAYEGIYDLFNRHRDTPWSNEERVSVVLQPEWNLGTGSRHPVNIGALIELVITAVRAYVVFVQQNEPVDPQEFRVKATELAFEMLEIYRLTALHRAADFRVWCVLLLPAHSVSLAAHRVDLAVVARPFFDHADLFQHLAHRLDAGRGVLQIYGVP